MLWTGGIGGDKRQVDLARSHAGQFDLCLFCRFLQSLHRHLVAGEINSALLFKGADHPIDDALIKIVAAQTVVASSCKNLLNTVAHLDDGNVECTAAEVIHHDLLLFALVDAIGQSSCGRFIDNALYIKTGNLAGIFCSLTLCPCSIFAA